MSTTNIWGLKIIANMPPARVIQPLTAKKTMAKEVASGGYKNMALDPTIEKTKIKMPHCTCLNGFEFSILAETNIIIAEISPNPPIVPNKAIP